jgi:hypothetical protein
MTEAAAAPALPASCSQAEFARLQGWEKSYVTKLKHEGRLVFLDDKLLDVAASLERIKATSGAPERAAPAVQGKAANDFYDKERFYTSELKRLEYEREIKKLREVDEVAAAVTDAGALIRTTIEAWRARLPAQLAAFNGDEQRISAFLSGECQQLLERMATKFAGLVGHTKAES